ncbi:hypothetical protein KCU64_g18966, partial [Aureobasidium melanogenum]
MSGLRRSWNSLFRRPWAPSTFPNEGFVSISADAKIEEETFPDYNASHFYLVRIGEILRDRYQIVRKLGFGGTSTVWLARDLSEPATGPLGTCRPEKQVLSESGQWTAGVPIPESTPFEARETALTEGNTEDREAFLRLMRKMIQWEPEKCAVSGCSRAITPRPGREGFGLCDVVRVSSSSSSSSSSSTATETQLKLDGDFRDLPEAFRDCFDWFVAQNQFWIIGYRKSNNRY